MSKINNRKSSPDYASSQTSIAVTLNFTIAPTIVKNSLATLKYDKDFAHSFTFDDALSTAITSGLPTLAGGTADDAVVYPALYYTDGCGNNKVFRAASAFYTVNSSGVDLHNGTPSNLTYAQLTTLYNAGWDVINHSWSHANGTGNTPGYSLGHPNYPIEISNNAAAMVSGIGFTWPHFIIPAGDINYLPDAILAGMRCIYNQAGSMFYGGSAGFQIDGIEMERPFELFRISRQETDTYPTVKSFIDIVAGKSINGAKYWFNDFTHSLTASLFNGGMTIADFANYMGYVASTYGAAGTDRVWMAPLQEVWEYIYLREKTILGVPLISGSSATFSVNHNVASSTARRYAWTIKITSDQNVSSVTVPTGYTATFRGTGTNRIINIEKQ